MKTLNKKILFLVALFVFSFAFLGAGSAQGDLDGDGIPDSEDPETIVSENKTLEAGEYTFKDLVITNGSILTLNSNPSLEGFKGVKITAENITIDSGSSISANGKGYRGGVRDGNTSAHGEGYGGLGPSFGGGEGQSGFYAALGGGGHGGSGGVGYNNNRDGIFNYASGGNAYGSIVEPDTPGAGGAGGISYAVPGGNGGGVLKLIVSGTLTIDGEIKSLGQNGIAHMMTSSGGGAGGSIWIAANTLAGNGSITANGGNGGNYSSRVCGGGGAGGRIAIYYPNSNFTGTTTATGGRGFENGGAGMVVIVGPSLDAPATAAVLSEESSSQSNLIETLLSQKGVINDVTVSGDLNGTLSFTNFEMVNIKSGSFAGKGFFKGEWQANLEGYPYKGNWQGMFFLKEVERRIYLKGTISGEISGIVEGYLTESVSGNGIYDQYDATGRLAKVGGKIVSATINLDGTINYQETTEYPSTELYALQTSIEGTTFGHYSGALETILTHIRVVDENNPYCGQGFSIISYVSEFGSGEGWTYDKLVSPGMVKLSGLFTDPLLGIVSGILDENTSPRTLSITIERIDFGLPPMADLKLKTWGPTRASPGQTINYIIEVRNDGIKGAENVTLVDSIPLLTHYISASPLGTYDDVLHIVRYDFENIPPNTVKYLSLKVEIFWGLPWGTTLIHSANVYPKEKADSIYQHTSPELSDDAQIVLNVIISGVTYNLPPPLGEIISTGTLLPDVLYIGTILNVEKYRNEAFARYDDEAAFYFNEVSILLAKMYNDPSYFSTQYPGKSFNDVIRDFAIRYDYKPPEGTTSITPARDPNIKYGPEGNVLPGQKLTYKVEYENEGEGIAFGVYFNDTLDEDLDGSTLEIGPVIDVKTGVQIAPPGIYNPQTRTITWFVGEVGSKQGGCAEFSVNVRSDAPDGTEIINFVTVYFPSVPETTRTNGIVSIVGLNQPPVANAGGSYTGDEGSLIILDASGSFDPDGDPLQYRWDFTNDGIWDTEWSTEPTANYTWGDDYQGTVKLEVSDGELTDINTAEVEVLNVPPLVEAEPDKEVYAGDTVSFSGFFTDTGWLDSHTALWDFGDGSVGEGAVTEENEFSDSTGSVTASYIYYDKGTCTVTLSVTDGDGGIGTDTFEVIVKPIPATIDFDPDTLNLKEKGKGRCTVYIELLTGYDIANIDLATIKLNGVVFPITDPKYDFVTDPGSYIVDHNKDGIPERMVKFDRVEVEAILSPGEEVPITITGKVFYNNGLADFEGEDIIKVIK